MKNKNRRDEVMFLFVFVSAVLIVLSMALGVVEG